MLSDFFYERETEYFGVTPFQLLDQIGAILVQQVIAVQDEVNQSLSEGLERHLSHAQINHVNCLIYD